MNTKYLRQAKDKVDAPCVLLSRLRFKFDILKIGRKILTGLPKHLRNRQS